MLLLLFFVAVLAVVMPALTKVKSKETELKSSLEVKSKEGKPNRISRVADSSIIIKKKRGPKKKETIKMSGTDSDDSADLRSLLLQIKQDQCTKTDMESFTNSVNSKLSSIEAKITSHDDKIESMNTRLQKCESQAVSAQYQLELEKQRQLKNNLSIFGVVRMDGENLKQIISSMFGKIGCAVEDHQIITCYRINGNGNNIIIVKLSDYELKLKVLKEKAMKPVTLGEIVSCDSKTSSSSIYINNHVTPFFGKLLKEGRLAVKANKIHSCWLNAFGCQMKFEENGKLHGFRSTDELNRLIANKPTGNQHKRGKPDDHSPAGNSSKKL